MVVVVLVNFAVEVSAQSVVPFRVLEVVVGDGGEVLFSIAAFDESDWPVVGCFCVPVEGRALESVIHLVEWVVVDVESVQCAGGECCFVGVVRLLN